MRDLGLHDELVKAFKSTQQALHKVQYDIEVNDVGKVMYDLNKNGIRFRLKYSIYKEGGYITQQKVNNWVEYRLAKEDEISIIHDRVVRKLITFYSIEHKKTYKVMLEIVDDKDKTVYFITYDGYSLEGKDMEYYNL